MLIVYYRNTGNNVVTSPKVLMLAMCKLFPQKIGHMIYVIYKKMHNLKDMIKQQKPWIPSWPFSGHQTLKS